MIHAASDIAELFRLEVAPHVDSWEEHGRVGADAFRSLGGRGIFARRWPSGDSRPLGDIEVQAELAEASALVCIGASLCFGIHADAFTMALRHARSAGDLYAGALAGEVVGAVGLTERSSGSDVTRCATTARSTSGGWRLDGHKHYVTNALTATHCVVLARAPAAPRGRDLALLVAPLRGPGVTIAPHDLAGVRSSGTARVDFRDVAVDGGCTVAPPGAALPVVVKMLMLERLWAAVAAAAVAALCSEAALAFATGRRIAGRRLRDHQLAAHRLADIASDAHVAHLVCAHTLATARDGILSLRDASRAKLLATRAAWRAADAAVQVLGGAGYTEATPLSRIWRDLRVSRIAGGSDEVLGETIAHGLRPGRLADHPAVRAAAAAGSAGDAAPRIQLPETDIA